MLCDAGVLPLWVFPDGPAAPEAGADGALIVGVDGFVIPFDLLKSERHTFRERAIGCHC